MKKFAKVLPLFLVLLVFVLIDGMTIPAKAKGTATIPETVYIGDINVSGMTEKEASAAIDQYAKELGSAKITLTTESGQIVTTAADLGVKVSDTNVVKEALNVGKTGNIIERYKAKIDLKRKGEKFDLQTEADAAKIKSLISSNTSKLNVEPVDASMTRKNGTFQITGGTDGVTVDVSGSVSAVQKYLTEKWDGKDASIELKTQVEKPKGSKDELAKVKDLLGAYHTDFSSSPAGRYKNVENGCSKVNGSVIYPGEQFSVYGAVSPFDAEHGYELAGSYENGTTVETYGGGICQVSTTLYNAVILSELQIDERHNHSMVVAYVKPSMDAAISGTAKDFKFTNDTDAPIYIEGYTQNGVLYFNIYGEETRSKNRVVSYESEVLTTTEPGVSIVASPAFPVGYVATTQSAHTGYTAKLWKVVTENGKEVSRTQFNSSTYRASNKIVTVGVATADPEANAQITAAVVSGDEATCRATAAAYAGR